MSWKWQSSSRFQKISFRKQTFYIRLFIALFRHSLHPLFGYTSKEAANEVRFVREVRPAELEKFAEENKKDLRESICFKNSYQIQVFAGTVPAVTIGTFSSEESEELRRFKKIAQMLNGRYHLVYIINTKAAPTVITIRPFEPLERTIEYVRNFRQRSLLAHVTHSSMPSLFDVDNDGLIPANELKIAIRESAYSFGLNADEAEFLIYNVDANKDDYVDFPEFSSLVSHFFQGFL
ncbi:EF-hand domain pair domain-containing protein [Ditylenchus destructor]|uniref:EF-hand domain pair domain-containing protein n=1 Tax=Ditylenchus destructor TaxID=166010 RepID=A0AAD4MGB0_9BILA|nr:EF-hand domain pair domain-containing protein [Ditylenchus destructor]